MSTEKPKLYYFPNRGKAETIRLMLVAAGVEWDDVHINTAQDVARFREEGITKFGQFPILELEGSYLVQSMAIVRFLARKYNMAGRNPQEAYEIDMLTEGSFDVLDRLVYHKFSPDEQFYPICKKLCDKYLPIFDKVLQQNGDGFLVGQTFTMADACYFDSLVRVEELFPEKLNSFPTTMDYYKRLRSMPHFSKYFKSSHFYPKNTDEIVDSVNKALNIFHYSMI